MTRPLSALERLLPAVPDHLYTLQDPCDNPDHPDAVRLTYLGTAGFVVQSQHRTLVLDPFISRPSLLDTALHPLQPDEPLIQRVIPHADDVLVGHSHHDHILDAPALCMHTGARLITSPDGCNVGRAAGLPEEQMVETRGREDIPCGEHAHVRGLPSLHGKAIAGRVPLPGPIPTPPQWPARFNHLRCGLVLNWFLEVSGVRIVHIDSADFYNEELEGHHADIVCLCAIGRKHRPNYVRDAVRLLKPKIIVACHWDWFFTHYDAEPRCIPGVDLAGFVREIRSEGIRPVVLPFGGHMTYAPASVDLS